MNRLDALFNENPSESQTSGKAGDSGWLGSLLKARAAEASQGAPSFTLPLVSRADISVPVVGAHAPGLLDRLTAGASNLTTGGNPLAGLFNAVNGLATGQRTDRAGIELAKQHATMTALMNAGLDSKTARAAAMNPEYLRALVVAHYGVRSRRGQAAAPPRARSDEAPRNESTPANDANAARAVVPSADLGKPQD
jgi:hypothetical protein